VHRLREDPVLSQSVHGKATYRYDDTRNCIMQFCPPDDEHMCSKHVEACNKLIIKFSASSCLILNKYTLRVFVKMVLRRILGSKQEKVTRSKELHNLCYSPPITRLSSHNLKMSNASFKNVAKFSWFQMVLSNQKI